MASFKLFAGTDIGLRDNNEDNFTVCPDLTQDKWIIPDSPQKIIPLSENGCMAVVTDGMGGQNAGEVASSIAVETVQQMFAPNRLSADILQSFDKIQEYIKEVIIEADSRIKAQSISDPSKEGMGATIVIAWYIGNLVYVGWLGDSRAYSFVPRKGIRRLSKDHSFVQRLVDANVITEEEAMYHPESNVITRSLGDETQKALPEVICHPAVEGEIILLCTDGLCGVCTDEVIANIMDNGIGDLQACWQELTAAALEADGSDNITIALLQIVTTDKEAAATIAPVPAQKEKATTSHRGLLYLLSCITALSLGLACYFWHRMTEIEAQLSPQGQTTEAVSKDTTTTVPTVKPIENDSVSIDSLIKPQ